MDMDTLEIGPYLVEFDRDATIEAYARIPTPGPERCGCWYCQNWVGGRERLVPRRIREVLDRLGIPLAGEIEVWEVPGDDAQHTYGGWYMFVGRIATGPKDWREGPTVDGWQVHFSEGQSYRVEAFDAAPRGEMNFLAPSVRDFIEPPVEEFRPNHKATEPRAGAVRRLLARFGLAI